MRRRLTTAVLTAVLAVGSFGAFAACAGSGPEDGEPTASCERDGCTDLPLEQIVEISGLDLPAGTDVLESRYVSFQDWHLGAKLRLPEGSEDPIAASEEDWTGAMDDDGVHRTAEVTQEEGRLVIEIEVFTS